VSDKNFWDRVRGAFSRTAGNAPVAPRGAETATTARRVVRIDFDMMLKGSVYNRPSGKVKQYGVTVNGATRVITSGDFLDRETYDALIKANAIRPMSEAPPPDAALPQNKRGQRRTG
jgi:hypothetical protein